MSEPDLDAAYALETPDDNRALYADWAQSYDEAFAKEMAYDLPRHVAETLAEVFAGTGPVLDVGAGTGLLAAHLPERAWEMDALDISPEMLAVAAGKGLYRHTIVGDLTQRLEMEADSYAAVVSSGTFTHGHVGPDALDELLRVSKPGALFVLSVNAEHFVARGFASKFATLGKAVENLNTRDVAIYGPGADPAHQADRALVGVVRKG